MKYFRYVWNPEIQDFEAIEVTLQQYEQDWKRWHSRKRR